MAEPDTRDATGAGPAEVRPWRSCAVGHCSLLASASNMCGLAVRCMCAAMQRPEEAELAAVAAARTRALEDLDQAISQSLNLLSSAPDPAAPEVLAADRIIAANARRALTLMKALQVPFPALVPARQSMSRVPQALPSACSVCYCCFGNRHLQSYMSLYNLFYSMLLCFC